MPWLSIPQIADHVLLPFAGDLEAADTRQRPKLTLGLLAKIVDEIPEQWHSQEDEFEDIKQQREAYLTYLLERLNGPRAWLAEAITAKQRGPKPLGLRQTHRVV